MNRSEAGKLGAEKARKTKALQHKDFFDNYQKNPKQCKQCNNLILFEKRRNRFCSHSCAAKFNNIVRGFENKKRISSCLYCSNDTLYKYCSKKCAQKHKHQIFIDSWLKGTESGVTCKGMSVSHHIKRWLRKERGDKCEICKWSKVNPITKKVPIQLDHIDGDALNNKVENLRLLCPNCHSLTSTFGSLNRGKGRKFRYLTPVSS